MNQEQLNLFTSHNNTKLTEEQLQIINTDEDIKLNAVAGSGKTTTLLEYAKTRNPNSKILYIAFNKSVKIEAQRKFKKLKNVSVETAHSLAFKFVMTRSNYILKKTDYRVYELANILNIKSTDGEHVKYILTNHIYRYFSLFCNSSKQAIKEFNYLDYINDYKARNFVSNFYGYIQKKAEILFSKMTEGLLDITHDFYLKQFQLYKPTLKYDYILFDEGQDASEAMLDIFLKQKAIKVIVGDTHQQIYGWRFAINSLEKVNFPSYNLTTSFRFSQNIANLATAIINLKTYINQNTEIKIKGTEKKIETKTKAVLARTNLGLLKKAIEYATERRDIENIYFEGNFNSYTYASNGATIYDILNLLNGNHKYIKDPLIKRMKDSSRLEEYISNSEDRELKIMLDVVKKYGDELPSIIKSIKAKHINTDDKTKAEIIFSTVHKAKGMEYDAVQLVDDFISESFLETINKENIAMHDLAQINEEINLLYVAVTRTRKDLHIPSSLLPKDFTSTNTEDEKKKDFRS
jgi:superfamily I DNA/RNA helicase